MNLEVMHYFMHYFFKMCRFLRFKIVATVDVIFLRTLNDVFSLIKKSCEEKKFHIHLLLVNENLNNEVIYTYTCKVDNVGSILPSRSFSFLFCFLFNFFYIGK